LLLFKTSLYTQAAPVETPHNTIGLSSRFPHHSVDEAQIDYEPSSTDKKKYWGYRSNSNTEPAPAFNIGSANATVAAAAPLRQVW
jgi:hypothetical protein